LAGIIPACAADRLVDELLARYDKVKTVSCEVRRTSTTPKGKVRSLSRVHYKKPDRIHVDSTSPIKRRHISNGERLYYYVEGDPKGFSKPVDELDEEWLFSLRQVPGTAMKHLFKIDDAEEDELPATEEFPVRRGYRVGEVYVVLSLGPKEKLQQVEYFDSPEMEKRILRTEYRNFEEVLPGVEIPCYHATELKFQGIEKTEDVQFLNMQVNKPIAKGIFDPDVYFEDVEFVGSFDEIYK